MFEKKIKEIKAKIKEKGLDVNTYLLEPKERYDKGYWEGYIIGLENAEGILKKHKGRKMGMESIVELIQRRITPMDSEKGEVNITRTFHKDDYKSLDIIIQLLRP